MDHVVDASYNTVTNHSIGQIKKSELLMSEHHKNYFNVLSVYPLSSHFTQNHKSELHSEEFGIQEGSPVDVETFQFGLKWWTGSPILHLPDARSQKSNRHINNKKTLTQLARTLRALKSLRIMVTSVKTHLCVPSSTS